MVCKSKSIHSKSSVSGNLQEHWIQNWNLDMIVSPKENSSRTVAGGNECGVKVAGWEAPGICIPGRQTPLSVWMSSVVSHHLLLLIYKSSSIRFSVQSSLYLRSLLSNPHPASGPLLVTQAFSPILFLMHTRTYFTSSSFQFKDHFVHFQPPSMLWIIIKIVIPSLARALVYSTVCTHLEWMADTACQIPLFFDKGKWDRTLLCMSKQEQW